MSEKKQEHSYALRNRDVTFTSTERRKSRGFPRGTLIYTPGGPVPIQLLRRGYMVFALSLDPGRQAEPLTVRPITSVHVHEHTPMLRVEYQCPINTGRINHVTVAPGQPLWTLDKGWVWAGEAMGGWIGPSKLALISGVTVDCDGKRRCTSTDPMKPGSIHRTVLEMEGAFLHYYWSKPPEIGLTDNSDAWDGKLRHRYGLEDDFRTTAYSIEVEGLHTFFVGPQGLLMGDGSCADEMKGSRQPNSSHP